MGAIVAGYNIRAWQKSELNGQSFELLVTSPLTRCIQTTVLAFLPGENYETPQSNIVCIEDVREAYGMYYPDKRREKSLLMVRSSF